MARRGAIRVPAGLLLALVLGCGLSALAAVAPAPSDWSEVKARMDDGDLGRATDLGLQLLADSESALDLPAQQVAFDLGVALIDAERLARAAEVQVALFERVPADWSAINASLTLSRLGRTEEADEVLAARLEQTPRAGELWSQRGVMWLGAGDIERARRHFGRAVRYGSENATLSLGRLALFEGDLSAARAAFRPGVDRAEPHAWGLRGWASTWLETRPR